jgi:hypothetical protein
LGRQFWERVGEPGGERSIVLRSFQLFFLRSLLIKLVRLVSLSFLLTIIVSIVVFVVLIPNTFEES